MAVNITITDCQVMMLCSLVDRYLNIPLIHRYLTTTLDSGTLLYAIILINSSLAL